ncbi:carbohydrate porin [Acetobacteraceae bacterium H6797]|nr:carbohydrate porin [Acetobacteraceae bacterium H6797]
MSQPVTRILPRQAGWGTGLIALALLAASTGTARAEEDCDDGHPIGGGLCLSASLTGDGFGNLTGGVRRGVTATGLGQAAITGEIGDSGWRFNASAYAIYGQQSTRRLAGSLTPPSNIEAVSTLRLNELWLEHDLGSWGSIRFGQIAADTEFTTADTAKMLISYNWPTALSTALPGGGAAYPLAVPGVRLELGEPDKSTGLRLGLLGGNPAGQYADDTDPQKHNRYGTNFSVSGGAFLIGEASTGAAPVEDGSRPWVLKLGAWFHSASTESQRWDTMGLSLANPASNGQPRRYDNNGGGYLVAEGVLWRGDESSLGVFTRLFAQPADRNLVSRQVDLGLAWRGPFGRADDTISLGLIQARVGRDARDLDRDRQALGETWPRRDQETLVELNYDWAAIPDRLSLRPLVQWIHHPAARTPDDRVSPDRPMKDALLVGMRVTLTY